MENRYVGSLGLAAFARACVAVFVACLVALCACLTIGAGQAHALSSKYKGEYRYVCGDPSTWGGTVPTKSPGYSLDARITKVKGNKVTLAFTQFRFYGTTGYYQNDSKLITVKLNKKRVGTFKFKTASGSNGKGVIKLVSKNKLKLRLKTTKRAESERIPPGTNWKYKTLKRV